MNDFRDLTTVEMTAAQGGHEGEHHPFVAFLEDLLTAWINLLEDWLGRLGEHSSPEP